MLLKLDFEALHEDIITLLMWNKLAILNKTKCMQLNKVQLRYIY